MKLHSMPLSPYAARVRIAVYAKKLDVQVVTPPADWRERGRVVDLNPLKRIPVLELDDGRAVSESAVIVEYLEDLHPEPRLRPADPYEAALARRVTAVVDGYAFPAAWGVFGALDPKADANSNLDRLGPQVEALQEVLSKLDAVLGDGGYAVGDALTTGDCAMGPLRFILASLTDLLGRADLFDAHPRVKRYYDMVERDEVLKRVQEEMSAGLKPFLAHWRKADGTVPDLTPEPPEAASADAGPSAG